MLVNSKVVDNFIEIKQLDQYMYGHSGYIAGGVFKNIFNNEKFKDVDIFFENKKDQIKAYIYYKSNENFKEIYKNEKVDAFLDIKNNISIELIKYVFGKPLDIINSFDFTITKFGYIKEIEFNSEDDLEVNYKIIYDDKFFEHLHLKRLVINEESLPLRNALNTFNRTYRYSKYGYYPCLETKKILINEILRNENINLNDIGGELYNGLD